LHLRVRSPASLTLSGDAASGARGASLLTIRRLWASSGTPSVRAMPQAAECPSSDHACDVSKLSEGSEYRIDVAGPSASAWHVIGATAAGAEPKSSLLSGSGYRGVSVELAGRRFAVVGSDASPTAPSPQLSYRTVPQSVQVVVDAPASSDGLSDVSASLQSGECQVQVAAHATGGAGLPSKPLIFQLGSDCTVTDDGAQPASLPGVPNGGNAGGSAATDSQGVSVGMLSTPGGNSGSPAAPPPTDANCALDPTRSAPRPRRAVLFGALAALGASRLRRRARSRRRQRV
jgi:hypothetical protein